jgi:peptide/nickel transport system substrate-binding protein
MIFGGDQIMKKQIMIQLVILLLLGMVIGACQPQVIREEVIVTQEVERVVTEQVEVEKIVTQQVIVEVEAPAPEGGGEAILAYYQEPQILNPYISTQTAANDIELTMIEGLVQYDDQGNWFPVLAEEVPTPENGQVVVEDGVLMVTYNIKEGMLWSTGQPFTCDDMVFTWEAVMNPESGAVSTADFANITSLECPDELTAVVTYEPFYGPYLNTFSAVLPRHATGAPEEMQRWPYNWHPIGTGPFKLQEWVPGDHITLVKNEFYRDAPEKPYLDKLIVRITPSREVGIALLQTGEIDFLWDLLEGNVPDLENLPGVVLNSTPGSGVERLVVNLADPALDAPDDPLNNPHPLLGDVRVRKAIDQGINKQEIIDVLLYGLATIGTKERNNGWGSDTCDIPEAVYDPAASMALLDEAGFTDEDGDGIRECNGCLYANQGDPLRLKIQTTSGNELREQTEQLIIEYMADIGIDMYIENVPSAVLFGSWASGAFRKHGQYDILMYTTSDGIDPHGQMEGYFGTQSMPTEANGGSGFNYSRWVNPLNDLITQAGNSASLEERADLYCQVEQAIADELPHIYLYNRSEIHATAEGLEGYLVDSWNRQLWNVADWRWADN